MPATDFLEKGVTRFILFKREPHSWSSWFDEIIERRFQSMNRDLKNILFLTSFLTNSKTELEEEMRGALEGKGSTSSFRGRRRKRRWNVGPGNV